MRKTKKKKIKFNRFGSTPLFIMILILAGASALAVLIKYTYQGSNNNYLSNYIHSPQGRKYVQADKVLKFNSEEEFKKYLKQTEGLDTNYGFTSMGVGRSEAMEKQSPIAAPSLDNLAYDDAGRYSETNVQVAGIDEADIVKTDGKQIYYSNPSYIYYGRPMPMMDIDVMPVDEKIAPDVIMPPYYQTKTSIINAWPVEDLALNSEIDLNGKLLLDKETLIVLANDNSLGAYNVSDPKNPQKSWSMKLDNNSYLVSSRLYKGKIYLITSTYINSARPCPYKPLIFENGDLEIKCTDIYHPLTPVYSDSTYTAISIDAQSGKLLDSVSFLASSNNSLVYMSNENLYISYQSDMPYFDIFYEFFSGSGSSLIPVDVLVKLNKLKSYDLSYRAKEVELEQILSDWERSLTEDQRLKLENDLENKINDYYQENKRRFVSTGIIKISLDEMTIKNTGKVPGRPLNQFSLDEYQGNLRIATTIGGNRGFGLMFFGSNDSANDVYVLSDKLSILGSVNDLGLSEQIYSVRFIEDKAYVVTFRQIDPFYIIDLSDPKQPKMTGELKIPGYSSYLHPMAQDRILGIGMENSQLKLSYFDVSDSQNPKEISKYTLDEYGSESLYDHHAFLQDAQHKIFFLPGYQGAYVFGYENDELELLRAISLNDIKRALYIGDYFYVVSSDMIVILDESDWKEVNRLEFEK